MCPISHISSSWLVIDPVVLLLEAPFLFIFAETYHGYSTVDSFPVKQPKFCWLNAHYSCLDSCKFTVYPEDFMYDPGAHGERGELEGYESQNQWHFK